jgi:hypothetical protein
MLAAWPRLTLVSFDSKARGSRQRADPRDLALFDSPELRGSEPLR